jgi:hypothetical protein
MKYRKLRIAWSVAWGIACLLLIAWWMRSYGRLEEVMFRQLCLASSNGHILCRWDSLGPTRELEFWSSPFWQPESSVRGFDVFYSSDGCGVMSPAWFVLLLLSVLTVGPWTPWSPYQFSLRTLLIVMTLVAVGLGWIVYVTR